MSWFVSEERIPVEGLPCQCDGQPHADGDTVWLRKELTPDGALEVASNFGESDVETAISWAFMLNGIVAWTFLDEKGEPVPCTRANIRRLKWEFLFPIIKAAEGLGYADSLMRPLVSRASRSSRNGQTGVLTSAQTGSGGSRRKP